MNDEPTMSEIIKIYKGLHKRQAGSLHMTMHTLDLD